MCMKALLHGKVMKRPLVIYCRVNWSLREILRGSDGVFTLYYNTPDGATELRARSVALTAPAYVVADLVRAAVPNASDALKSFDYPPVGAVTLAYPLSAIRDDRKAADGSVPGAHLDFAAPPGLQPHAACQQKVALPT